MTKVDEVHPYYKGIVLTSNGIGKGYMKKGNFERAKYKKNGITRDWYNSDNGFKMSNPIYYRNLLYSEEEREDLWIEKLDKHERWVGDIKIDRFAVRYKNENGRRPRRWFVTELGAKKGRIHLHGIYFEDTDNDELERIWKYGGIWVGDYCNRASITYIVKYMTKVDEVHPYYKGIVLTSNGIGKGYMKKGNFERAKYKKNGITRDWYNSDNGFKMSNPIYYRNLLYSEEEREDLWIEKLDKHERWVGDIKIDMTMKDADMYLERVLEDKRKLSKLCGFGDDSIDYDVRKYRREQAYLTKLQRIAKMKKG